MEHFESLSLPVLFFNILKIIQNLIGSKNQFMGEISGIEIVEVITFT